LPGLLTIAAILEIIALTIWVGAMASLAFIAAPAIFKVAPSRELAGKIFGLILKRFYYLAYGCSAGVLIAGALRWAGHWRGLNAAEMVRYLIALLMLGLTLYSGLVMTRKLEKLRDEMPGGIDKISKTDPRRAQFNKLHSLSTTLMSFNLLLGLAMAVLFVLEE
jgi:uncharacterized membrane protein